MRYTNVKMQRRIYRMTRLRLKYDVNKNRLQQFVSVGKNLRRITFFRAKAYAYIKSNLSEKRELNSGCILYK